MPVVRFETVRRDRTLSNFYLNQGRTTLGLNIAPSPNVIFKMNYILNHTFGSVPNVAGSIGERISERILCRISTTEKTGSRVPSLMFSRIHFSSEANLAGTAACRHHGGSGQPYSFVWR